MCYIQLFFGMVVNGTVQRKDYTQFFFKYRSSRKIILQSLVEFSIKFALKAYNKCKDLFSRWWVSDY